MCGAAVAADELEAAATRAVDDGRVPPEFRAALERSATNLVNRVNCPPATETEPERETGTATATDTETDTEPVETEPVETEPVETEPVETQPVETEPLETEPVETEPAEEEPAEFEEHARRGKAKGSGKAKGRKK